jgi:hypothetical protein
MARKPEVHTVHTAGGGWANKVGGKMVRTHRRKNIAVDRGSQIARRIGTEHAIHNMDGKIGRKSSYGHDPNPPKDKNR